MLLRSCVCFLVFTGFSYTTLTAVEFDGEHNFIAIYCKNLNQSSDEAKLIFGAKDNGEIVWLENKVDGSFSYFSARIRPDSVIKVLKRLDSIGAFSDRTLAKEHLGPDSIFTTIHIRYKGKELKMQSWHENTENAGPKIATATGIRGLEDGEDLLSALKQESSKYLFYRFAWLELRLAAARLIPSSGKPAEGRFRIDHGGFSWEFTSGKTSDH